MEIFKSVAIGAFYIIAGILLFRGVYKTPIKSHRADLGYFGGIILVIAGILYLLDKFTPYSFL